jgi:hypothetical protein
MPVEAAVERICLTSLIIRTSMSDFGAPRRSPHQRDEAIWEKMHLNHEL